MRPRRGSGPGSGVIAGPGRRAPVGGARSARLLRNPAPTALPDPVHVSTGSLPIRPRGPDRHVDLHAGCRSRPKGREQQAHPQRHPSSAANIALMRAFSPSSHAFLAQNFAYARFLPLARS